MLGTGGYASVSVILAAYLLRVETAICEQNSIPGLTNRVLGGLFERFLLLLKKAILFSLEKKYFLPATRFEKSFNPPFLKKGDRFTLLYLGGAKAHAALIIRECLDYVTPLWDAVEIIHQTGFQDFPWVKEAYEKKGVRAEVVPFITKMASVYRRVDLVVSRAGAISITEILVSGKPSVLIPYPHAAYNHQEMNAKILTDKGAARMILDKDLRNNLGEMIFHLINHPEELKGMGDKAKVLARPEAARAIIDHYFPEGEGDLLPRETKGGNCHL